MPSSFPPLKKIAAAAFALGFASTALFAEEEKPMISAEVCIHVWQSAQTGDDLLPTYDGLFYQNGKRFEPVTLREGTRTDGLKYRGDGWFRLFKQEQQDDKMVYVPVGSVQLEPGSKQVLAYAFPFENKFNLRAVGIDHLLAKTGQFQFVNFSKQPMELSIAGQAPLRVKPGGNTMVSIREIEGGILQFTIRVPHGKAIRQVYARSTAISTNGNYLGFLYEVSGRDGQYRFFIERGLRRLQPPLPEP